MSIWDEYPAEYRKKEITKILGAVQAGECVLLVGLSGAGKSNLMGFLYHRCQQDALRMALVDGNQAQPCSAAGLFRLTRKALGSRDTADDEYLALEVAVAERLEPSTSGVCLLFDRYDALDLEQRARAAGPLRSLRDAYKYRLTYVLATRCPPDPSDELAELFYANTLWLGPLQLPDALWSASQYARRRGLDWNAAILERLVELSWGYPSLLRACCEAFASGAQLESEVLSAHAIIQRRVQEFWADRPSAEDLRMAGLAGQPLLGNPSTPVQAGSPDLTAGEHRLLAYFQSHPDEVCSKDDLIKAVWPEDRVVDGLRDDSLAQLIRRLRQKVETDPGNPRHILTVSGRGYRYIA